MNYRALTIILTAIASLVFSEAFCQKMPERRLVRKGNKQYERGDFDTSLDNYARALQNDPNCFEAKCNTANGQFRKELIDKSEQTLRKLAQDSTRTDIERSEVAYNLGNTLFVQQRLEEALDCYRNAMRLNPDDKEAKFNYALTKELLKQQQNQQQQQQNQDQNQDQNQNQDQQQQQQPQDQQDKEQNQDQKEQEQQSEQQISEQEQQAMLEAIQAQEDKTQDKLKEKKGVLIRGGKNW
jgi:tetratricopeptide (TPR) repeat protein